MAVALNMPLQFALGKSEQTKDDPQAKSSHSKAIEMHGDMAVECFGKLCTFSSNFFGHTELSKSAFGVYQGTDVAIWTGLTGAGGGPNYPCDHTLRNLILI